jgi:ppGpp synthetase/RelA/SpoT-type nucleotidyltranferase
MSNKRLTKATGPVVLTAPERATIENCIKHFIEHKHLFQIAADGVTSACIGDPHLKDYIHFIKHRVKDPEHLRAKLRRNALDAKKGGGRPAIDVHNLFEKITDLAGVRILHLYTDQIESINKRVVAILAEQKYTLVDGPTAHIWDNEAERYFKRLGIATQLRDTMYTSVHYVIELSTASRVRCELQVRTLADELWGEVSHTVDYPRPTKSIACKEQLKVLARVTSGCTRLVDSIFRSQREFEAWRPGAGKKSRLRAARR